MGTSSPRYHITKRGEPGLCRATVRCPLGARAEHYSTPEEAYRAFESSMRGVAIPEAQNAYQRSKAIRSRKEDFRAKLDRLAASLEPKSKNWGELQEFTLGVRSLLNDLEDLDVASVTMSARSFFRRDGKIFDEAGREIVISDEDLTGLSEALSKTDRSGVHTALSRISEALGFGGAIPVAASSEKIDLRIVSINGYEFRASAKSFTGGLPSLQDPSKHSYAAFRTRVPSEKRDQVEQVLKRGGTLKEQSEALRAIGVEFPKESFALAASFRQHLKESAGEGLESAYAEMLHSRLSGSETISDPQARNRIIGAYATKMTNTGVQSDPGAIANSMLEVHKDGRVDLFASEDPEKIGEHLSGRIRVDNASSWPSTLRLVGDELQVKVYASFRIRAR